MWLPDRAIQSHLNLVRQTIADFTSCCITHEEIDDSIKENQVVVEADLDEKDNVCGVKNICDYHVKIFADASTDKYFMLSPKAGPYNIGATIAACKKVHVLRETLT